jgi:8-oxo-dGTP diphosphatase
MKRIEVVAAVIVENGRLFATQRGYGEFKDYWEFPGGKIEPGETPEEALRREIREELDTTVEVGGLLTTVEYDYPQFHLTLLCYCCRVAEGSLTLKEHEAAVWIDLNRVGELNWLPADLQLLPLLKTLA